MSVEDGAIYERWEYHTEFVEADAKKATEFLAKRHPGEELPKFALQATLPRLNELGELGWELVHIEPVKVGTNADVQISNPSSTVFSHTYFCTFKRRKRF